VLPGALVVLGIDMSGRQSPATAPAEPSIVFESPQENGYASGPIPLRIRVEPRSADVKSVSLFADGQLVCTLVRPPFECSWDAGPQVSEHTLRATVQLAGGQRILRSIRTRGEAYTETVDVDVVQVTATVTDGDGRFVRGLDRDAFRVFEDNVQQTLTSFHSENIPLEIIVAVDVSGSMVAAMPTVKVAVKKFLSALRPTDRVTVLGFNDNVFTLARPNVDLATRLKAIDRLAPWGGTALYDLVVQAIDQLGRQTGRRALVVFTDGEDLNSHTPLDVAERRLEASDVTLYPIGQGRAPRVLELRTVLEQLAKKSGGRAFFKALDKLDEVFSAIIDELSNQYLLGFVPKSSGRDGRWRVLRVEVPKRDVKIRTRQGYRLVAK
jgi:Ca-activated chloride channel family protein